MSTAYLRSFQCIQYAEANEMNKIQKVHAHSENQAIQNWMKMFAMKYACTSHVCTVNANYDFRIE